MVNRHEIIQAGYHNIIDNQIGGETDGITPEVAADIGYLTPEEFKPLAASIGKEKNLADTSTVVCGDCGAVGGCQHMGRKPNGRGFTDGY